MDFIKIRKGFTLIELLVVMAIISILATVTFVALNPAKRFADARNSTRWSDINSLLTAVHECIVDRDGVTSACIGSLTAGTVYEIVTDAASCSPSAACTTAIDCVDLNELLAAYLKKLPTDPGGVTANYTEYTINIDSNNIITIAACSAENGETIEISQ